MDVVALSNELDQLQCWRSCHFDDALQRHSAIVAALQHWQACGRDDDATAECVTALTALQYPSAACPDATFEDLVFQAMTDACDASHEPLATWCGFALRICGAYTTERGVDAALAAMRCFPDAAPVQAEACALLCNACGVAHLRAAMTARGGVSRILRALVRHAGYGPVQRYGLHALCRVLLAGGADAAATLSELLDGSDSPALLHVLERTPVLSLANVYGSVLLGVLCGMLPLQTDGADVVTAAAAACFHAVVTVMERHSASERVQRFGCDFVAAACTCAREHLHARDVARAFTAVLVAQLHHSGNEAVQRSVAAAIHALESTGVGVATSW